MVPDEARPGSTPAAPSSGANPEVPAETDRTMDEGGRLLALCPYLLTVTTLDGKTHRRNPGFFEGVLGWSDEALRTKSWFDLIHPLDLEPTLALRRRLWEGEKIVDHQLRLACRDGSYRWVSTTVIPAIDEDRIYSFGHDVTERRATEETLRRSEERLRLVFEEGPMGVAVTDGDLCFVRVNSAFARMLGYSVGELAGRSFADVTHPEDAARHAGLVRHLMEGEIPGYEIEGRYLNRHGKVIWARLRAAALREEEGELLHVAVVEDITDTKEAEAARRELDALKDGFVRVVSHDLQNPLLVIAGLADLLAEPGLDQGLHSDIVRRIAGQARRLARMVDSLLDLDRLYLGEETIERRTTDLAALAARVAEAVDLGPRPLTLPTEAVVARVDPDHVERILENLLLNAAVHTPPGTPVWLTVEGSADGASVVVEDAGRGVPDALKETVFGLFRTGDATARRGGTGLWVVRRLAEFHGGRAWVEDRPGGGASFHVFLPGASPERGPPEHGPDG